MYRVIKVLNNNGILVYHVETGKEMILLGNGVGFGKKPTEQIEKLPGAKVYSLVTRRKQESVLKTVNGIRPEFIEATGKIIEEAENVFQKINHEMLLPLADHIALAAKRAKENRQLPNPFTPDIRVLFGEEYQVALKGREIIQRLKLHGITSFRMLFRGNRSRSEVVATFLAVLELCRACIIHLAGSETDCTVRQERELPDNLTR